MKRMATMFAILGVLALLAAPASAVTVWDQSDFDMGAPGFFNSVSGSPPFGMTWYTLCDVTVPADEVWMVNEIVQWYGALDPNFAAGIFQGALNIIPKTGTLPGPGDDPTLGIIVPMSATVEPSGGIDPVIVVRAQGLSVQLEAGDYWIGITPEASAPFGPEPQLASMTQIGDASASYDAFGFPAPMWFDFNGGVDATILINAEVAIPAAETSFGQVKALFGK